MLAWVSSQVWTRAESPLNMTVGRLRGRCPILTLLPTLTPAGLLRPSSALALVLPLMLAGLPAGKAAPAPTGGRWTLTWSDEFNGPAGTSVDPAKWNLEIGCHGFGNNELQCYTDRTRNARLEKGKLVITAHREDQTSADGVTRNYTSARLHTRGKFSQQYGRFEARIRIPRGQGIWPAFWMMGSDLPQAGWPQAGEIDIMENIGREPSTVHGTIHGPGYSGEKGVSASFSLPKGRKFADKFHVYAVEWEPGSIRFFVDRKLYRTITPKDLPAGTVWAFDRPFFLILNVAVGGDWPGNPDTSTVFPQTMQVDYVRVYRR